MTAHSIKAHVEAFVVESLLNGKPIATDADLLLSGLVDSLGVMRLVRHVDETLGIAIPAEDIVIENFETIDAIAAYLETRRAA